MGKYVQYDFSVYREFFDRMGQVAKGDFRKDLELWLEAAGYEFLKEVEEQIIQRNVMNSRLLLNSFAKGNDGNVWEIDFGALCLEVGSNLDYATWANNGHHQSPGRYIPGYWDGDNFVYDKNAKTGMVLKAEWVKGKHYFDAALKLFAPVWEKSFEIKLEEWITQYFE
jgi:hypothetical protein